MKKILFVDDEEQALKGLKRMLRSKRKEWGMVFVSSGQQALEEMEKARFHAVVTDLRMPGMDGVSLLREVKKRHPSAIRIILSAHSDQQYVFRSVKLAHQFLAKPCGADHLTAVLARACTLSDLLIQPELAPLIAQIETLPTLPEHYLHLLERIEAEDSSLGEIGEIISHDMSMSATVLKMVNSAFFGRNRHISDPAQAVGYLGLDIMRALVLSQHLFSIVKNDALKEFSYDKLWSHCSATAGLCRQIAESETSDSKMADQAFVAGLLHDMGKLVLSSVAPEKYREALALMHDKGYVAYAAEQQVLGISHSEAGAYLLGLWGMDDLVVEALLFHHWPRECTRKGFSPLFTVHVADVLINQSSPDNTLGAVPILDPHYMNKMGAVAMIDKWRDLAKSSMENGDE